MNRVEEALSREKPSLVYVKYNDHVEFRNTNPSRHSVREAVGWLVGETDEDLFLLCEKSVKPLPSERPPRLSFTILKSEVVEMRRIKK